MKVLPYLAPLLAIHTHRHTGSRWSGSEARIGVSSLRLSSQETSSGPSPSCADEEDIRLRDVLQHLFCNDEAAQVLQSLTDVGIGRTRTLLGLSKNLQPVEIHRMLHEDFGLSVLHAHQARAAVLQLQSNNEEEELMSSEPREAQISLPNVTESSSSATAEEAPTKKHKNYKSVVVNQNAKLRKRNNKSYDYGLPRDYAQRHPQLAHELDDFLDFMTQPNPYAQEDPIRHATATVYVRHAKLFLGWYRATQEDAEDLSIYHVLPDASRDSMRPLLDFLRYLQQERHVSVNYQANILRGLVKLAKFRFREESQAADSNQLPFADVPLIQELRKYHRNAHKQQQKAPRSSNENKKWIEWTEYLRVVKIMGDQAQVAMSDGTDERTVAVLLQKYLVLALLAHVPDRQRTIRELEIGRNLVRGDKTGHWTIRHAPEDYKTGKAYGERPPMSLAPLSQSIDDFVENWRPALQPCTDHLFCQAKTGRPLTGDSVYQIVVRSCFEHTGKRTNPHLLRDMIVTHVRQSNASEKQLEALALYMAHSLQVQRASYDRRTLSQKVEPAVELLQIVNADLQ